MKVLMFVNRFYPQIGGVEKHTLNIARELVKLGISVKIVTIKDNIYLDEYERLEGIDIFRLKYTNICNIPKTKRIRAYFWLLIHISLILETDIIHCHDFSTFWNWYLPFRFLLPWKKVFVTFHGWEGIFPPEKKVISKRKVTENFTEGNICIGDYISKWYGTKPDIVSYGGVQLQQHHIKQNGLRCIYIGRLEKDTGIDTYLNALIVLKDKYNVNLKTNICGDGTLRLDIQNKARKNGLDCIFHGFVKDVEIYLNDVTYCFTSGYLSMLEAMVQKKVVISTFDNDLKKDYLCMIPEYDKKIIVAQEPEELAEKIYFILNNEQHYNNLVNKGFEWAVQNSWDEMAKKYLKLWSKGV